MFINIIQPMFFFPIIEYNLVHSLEHPLLCIHRLISHILIFLIQLAEGKLIRREKQSCWFKVEMTRLRSPWQLKVLI